MAIRALICAGMTVSLLGASATVQATEAESPQVVYGFDRDTSEMWRYDFSTAERQSLGPVRDQAGNVFRGGINGSAYAYGADDRAAYDNIFAFRWDEETYRAQMLWVDVRNGEAQVGNGRLEGGPIGGATAVLEDGQWNFYVVQHEKVSPPFYVNGTIALSNPNNSRSMTFELVTESGDVITREDLKHATLDDLDANGNLWAGAATQFRIRPMGQGNQNDLMVTYPGEEPEVFELRNSNTYLFTGTMEVRLHNPQMAEGGGSMGDWFLDVDGSVRLGDEVEVLLPHRLVHVAHRDEPAHDLRIGTVTELAELGRPYDSLASRDGQVFYAGYQNELWRIDLTGASAVEEQLNAKVANPVHAKLYGLDFVGDELFTYEVHDGVLHQLNRTTGQRELRVDEVNFSNLGTIVFCPVDRDRHHEPVAYD